jgi:hypothetical protein
MKTFEQRVADLLAEQHRTESWCGCYQIVGQEPHVCANHRATEDGPEVELIRFFTRFPNGATCNCAPPFEMWREIASRVNPNA